MTTLFNTYRKKFKFGGDDWTGLSKPEDEWSGMSSDRGMLEQTPSQPATNQAVIPQDNSGTSSGIKGMGNASVGQGIGALAGTYSSMMDANLQLKQGITKTYGAGPGATYGAAKGAQIGSSFGPIGALVGFVGGGIYGYAKGKSNEKKEQKAIAQLDVDRNRQYNEWSQARLANNPNFAVGDRNAEMYKNGGDLFKTNKRAFVDSTLNANQNLNFVKRLRELNTPSIQVPGLPGRSTHLMSYDPGTNRVFPEVVQQNGQLVRLQGDNAWDYADSTKEYIPFNTTEKAEWFANNGYKQGTGVLKRENGGELKRKYQAKFTDYTGTQIMKQGGSLLSNIKTNGGSMLPMSKDTTLASGKSHTQGGIELPNLGAELEGGETTSKDYVFSKALGFAQLHKPIARAEGKIQNKPATAERMKSLELLGERTERLKATQEMVKQQLNLQ